MSTAPDTAIVTTLTAQVHVLMVGSRQVTMSVFKQLDEVLWDDMEPMGRVNINHAAHWGVGVDRKGLLVCARFHIQHADDDAAYARNRAVYYDLPHIVLAGLR